MKSKTERLVAVLSAVSLLRFLRRDEALSKEERK
jgi:hypothetical protein